jgi:hypothetical protein
VGDLGDEIRKAREALVGANDHLRLSGGKTYPYNREEACVALAACLFRRMRGEKRELPHIVNVIASLKTPRERANAIDQVYKPPANPYYMPIKLGRLIHDGVVECREDLTEAEPPFYAPRAPGDTLSPDDLED